MRYTYKLQFNLDCWTEEKYNWSGAQREILKVYAQEENIRVRIFVFSFFIQQTWHCFVGLFLVVKALAAEGKWVNELKSYGDEHITFYNQFAEYVLLVPGVMIKATKMGL